MLCILSSNEKKVTKFVHLHCGKSLHISYWFRERERERERVCNTYLWVKPSVKDKQFDIAKYIQNSQSGSTE